MNGFWHVFFFLCGMFICIAYLISMLSGSGTHQVSTLTKIQCTMYANFNVFLVPKVQLQTAVCTYFMLSSVAKAPRG